MRARTWLVAGAALGLAAGGMAYARILKGQWDDEVRLQCRLAEPAARARFASAVLAARAAGQPPDPAARALYVETCKDWVPPDRLEREARAIEADPAGARSGTACD